jgi:hypothetical protein
VVEYDIINDVRVKGWNVDPRRLVAIFQRLYVVPSTEPIVFNIYEPLVDVNAVVLNQITFESTVRHIFIIYSAEGHSEQEYDRLLHRFKRHPAFISVNQTDIILYTAAFELVSNEYHHIQNISGILNNTLELTGTTLKFPQANKPFLFLNRLHRWQRQELFEELYRQDLLGYCHASYLEHPPTTAEPGLYPMVLDKADVSFEDGYTLPDDISAVFNIVSESSYENIGDLTSIAVPGISEKTYKTILNCQLPIFLSSYKTVYYYRLMGFDAFDDIVDHSYDLITCPRLRIKAIANEIKRLSIRSDFIDRDSLYPRFLSNYRMMLRFRDLHFETYVWHIKLTNMKAL